MSPHKMVTNSININFNKFKKWNWFWSTWIESSNKMNITPNTYFEKYYEQKNHEFYVLRLTHHQSSISAFVFLVWQVLHFFIGDSDKAESKNVSRGFQRLSIFVDSLRPAACLRKLKCSPWAAWERRRSSWTYNLTSSEWQRPCGAKPTHPGCSSKSRTNSLRPFDDRIQ